MSRVDLYDTFVAEPDDPMLQRRAAQYVVDQLDEQAALEVLAMLFAPVRS